MINPNRFKITASEHRTTPRSTLYTLELKESVQTRGINRDGSIGTVTIEVCIVGKDREDAIATAQQFYAELIEKLSKEPDAPTQH